MKEEDDLLFYGKWVIGFCNRREEGTLFALQPFFLFDIQVFRIFRLKDRLIILKAVTYMVCGRMCS